MPLWLKDDVIVMNSLDAPFHTENCPCDAGAPPCTHCQSPVPQLQLTVPSGTLTPGGTATCLSCAGAEGVFLCELGPGVGGCVWSSPIVSTCDGNIFHWTLTLSILSAVTKILAANLEVRNSSTCVFTSVARFTVGPIPGPGAGMINCQTRLAHLVLNYVNNPTGNTSRCVSSSGKTVTVDVV